jgi:hypothetical protein
MRKPTVQQRDAARREALAVVPLGSSTAEVLGRLGAPDVVEVEVKKGYVFIEPYFGLEQLAPDVYSQWCFFLHQSIGVQFQDLRAVNVFPLDEKSREHYAADADRARASRERGDRDPPRVGMTPEEAGERWRSHVVSAQLKDSEYMTLPTHDPAARLGHEVNRWYCLGRRQVVNFSDGRVTSIEPLEGEREAAVRSFWIRTIDAPGPKSSSGEAPLTFLHPILAAAAIAGISIPIIIHLLMRRRRKAHEVGRDAVPLEAYRQQRRRMRLEQLLLLAARCLLIMLAGLAIARPLLGSAGVLGGRGAVTLYVLIDNGLASSAAEGGKSALDRHKARALALLDQLDTGSGDRVG